MLRYVIIVAWCCLLQVQATEVSPRIIIIGSGPAGIAASARLLENGFENIRILEAENRIGGRVYTTEFGGYPIDVGGQWVHGEENNAVFELVWPLGLLEKMGEQFIMREQNGGQLFNSLGTKIPNDTATALIGYFLNLFKIDVPEEYNNKSIGHWYTHKLDEYFKVHPEIMTDQREPLKKTLCLMKMALDSADSWFNVSVDEEQIEAKGDQSINWKDKTYGTIIDILLKKFPNPSEELPFRNKTVLNAEVTRINYNNSDGTVLVITENGDEYAADHVIVTTSLGVLKSDHEKLFNPPLSDVKINAIKNIGFGSVAKIYLSYSEPWWPSNTDTLFTSIFYWTDEDRKTLANDPNKSWLLGLYSVLEVEHRPGILCCWITGPYARKMETVPEEIVLSGTKEIFHKFLGKTYNLTEPTAMLRSQWYTNKHFRGTYSYRSPETKRSGAMAIHLAEPIMKRGKPRFLFAGEATSPHQFAFVHGAIGTGWREANRLMKLYGRQIEEKETSQSSSILASGQINEFQRFTL